MDHAAELRRAFDALPVDFRHYVILLQAGFGRRAVRNNLSQYHAAFGGQLQCLGFVRGHFMCFHAEPARTIVTDDDIQVIGCNSRLDFNLRGFLILQRNISDGFLKRVCISKYRLLILLALHLRL